MRSTTRAVRDLLALGRPDAQRLQQQVASSCCRLRPVMMLSSTLMPLNSARFWKVRAMPISADLARAHVREGLAAEGDRALLRLVDAVDAVEHRALAGAVRADDRADLVLADVEADVGQRLARRRSARLMSSTSRMTSPMRVPASRASGARLRRRGSRRTPSAHAAATARSRPRRDARGRRDAPVRPSSNFTCGLDVLLGLAAVQRLDQHARTSRR